MYDYKGLKALLEHKIWYLEIVRQVLLEQIEKAPQGILRVNRNGKTKSYSLRVPDQGASDEKEKKTKCVYLGEEGSSEVRWFVAGRVAKEAIKKVDAQLNTLKETAARLQPLDLQQVFTELPKKYQGLIDEKRFKEYIDDEILKRLSVDLTARYHNSRRIASPANTTVNGTPVRSKNELLVWDLIERTGMPFDYEPIIYLEDVDEIVQKSPDYKVMSRTGMTVNVEVWGKLDDPEYLEDNINKLSLYHRNNIDLGDNLLVICSHQNGSLNCYSALKLLQAVAEM
ncbi:MAG: hypothetical protein IIY82_07530 [Firmicutes bacterium]|nr:hypothetical protein [Bacillota bacterium]